MKRKKLIALFLSAVTSITSLSIGYYPDAIIQTQAAISQSDATKTASSSGVIFADSRTDFRDESIYFVMTTRFYDGDTGNNVQCWDGTQYDDENDPEWRGDFKGLAEKLDYIKALGFTAIWITPVVENCSGYDYHGYHALDFTKVDPRYESDDFTYQDFIKAAHAKGLKVIQDVVFNHTGNFGERNLFPIFDKEGDQNTSACLKKIEGSGLPENYDSLTPFAQYQARLTLMKNMDGVNHDVNNIYHHDGSMGWEEYSCQTGQIADDCVDLNTENPTVYKYLQNAYKQYIDMGVDAFRVDTTKHISRLTFNNALTEPFYEAAKANGNDSFYMFGEVCTRVREVWNKGVPPLSSPFYTWKESKSYPWSETDSSVNEASTKQNYNDNLSVDAQPTSDNALLKGNDYHKPDYSQKSGMGVIDFPMHWNFENAHSAFRVAVDNDRSYNDATWNVTYVDSHDYAPDQAPSDQRFAGSQDTWAENLSLMFTFRGIPCIYYGSEIEFQKGAVIDKGPNIAISETGRAYFGDHIEGDVLTTDFAEYFGANGTTAETLSHPLALHIQRLNQIRQAVPALRKGQYSVSDISGNDMAYKRRYTDDNTDSFALVTVSGTATFNNIPNGTYVDCITGEPKKVSNGTLTADCSGKGNLRVYVLNTSKTPAPGKVGQDGKYLYTNSSVETAQQQCIYFNNEAGWSQVTANLFGSNGNLVESLPMTNVKDQVYACKYSGNAQGLRVVFTNGSSTSAEASFQNGGLYNNSGYISQYQIGGDVIQVTDVKLSPKQISMNLGETYTVNAEVLPENAKYKTLSWTSSNTDVATVKNGVITPQDEGTAVITATSKNGIQDQVTVTVTVPPYDYEEVPDGYTAIYFSKPKSWGNSLNAYIYYGDSTTVTSGWPGSSMEKLPNGVYRYVFKTPAASSMKVLFNDGSNQAPGSVGFDVVAYGKYGQNGLEEVVKPVKPTPTPTNTPTPTPTNTPTPTPTNTPTPTPTNTPTPTVTPVPELQVKLTADKQSPQQAGTSVRLDAAAEGGKGALQYRFYRVANGKTTIFRDYGKSATAYCNPAAGDYKVYVEVKDESGKTATASMDYSWRASGETLKITEIQTDKQSPQPKGSSVKLTVNAQGGSGILQYRFYRMKDNTIKVFRDYQASNVAYCNPDPGTYTIYVDVKDSAGNIATEKLQYTWEEQTEKITIKSLTASQVSPQPLGTSIRFNVEAEGGTGSLQYRFSRVFNGKTTVIRDYAAGTKAYCNPPAAGDYTILVEVKDAAGNTAKASLTYSWGAPSRELQIKNMAVSKVSPQPKGTSVCFEVSAEDGEGELQYRFYRVGNGNVTIFRDFSTSNKAYCNPSAAGSYTVYVDVKDKNGNLVTSQLPYVWK